MKINDLKRISEAPEKGWLLALTRQRVIFEPYHHLNDVTEKLSDMDLLELHLFDEQKEYRMLSSARRPIEWTADFDVTDIEHTYEEKMYLEAPYKGKKLTVYNHIHYDENGMIQIDDYRLSMGGGHE